MDSQEDGVDIEFIYQLTKTEEEKPDKPESVQADDDIPEGWSDNPLSISEEYQFDGLPYVWKIMVFDQNGQNQLYEPDGELKNGWKFCRIYFQTYFNRRGSSHTPSSSLDDDPPEGWSDDPVGVDMFWPYEWYAYVRNMMVFGGIFWTCSVS